MTSSLLLPAKRIRALCLAGALAATGLGSADAALQRHRVPPIGAYTTRGAWSFVSAPRVHPPRITARGMVRARQLAHGLFLVATLPNLAGAAARIPLSGEGGPLILDNRLRPVWVMPAGVQVGAADLQQQTLDARPVLTWWQGTLSSTGQTKSGQDLVVDEHYQRLARLQAAAPWVISQHDMVITPPHNAWVTVYRNVRGENLSRYHGPAKGTVYDVGIQEYDLSTGQLLYTWDALNPGGVPNIPLSDSETRPEGSAPWDAYHINSVQPIDSGQFLVSMRNTWGVYLIDQASGHVVWKVSGDPRKPSAFKVAANARFEFQHDVRLEGDRLTMFDDACCAVTSHGASRPHGPSRGLVLKLDMARRRVTLAHQYLHHPALDTFFLGSTRILPGGNVLVGWGSLPYFTEFSHSGRALLEAVFPGAGKDINYRALFTPSWVGTPYYPPRAVLRRRGRRAFVYVSWNGATDVARWRVLGGASAGRLKMIGQASRSGFETAIRLHVGKPVPKVMRVQALDRKGNLLRDATVSPR